MSGTDLYIHFGSNHHHHLQESHLAPFQVTKEWQDVGTVQINTAYWLLDDA
jgi:hypothetical protein